MGFELDLGVSRGVFFRRVIDFLMILGITGVIWYSIGLNRFVSEWW